MKQQTNKKQFNSQNEKVKEILNNDLNSTKPTEEVLEFQRIFTNLRKIRPNETEEKLSQKQLNNLQKSLDILNDHEEPLITQNEKNDLIIQNGFPIKVIITFTYMYMYY